MDGTLKVIGADGRPITCRAIDGKFPDWRRVCKSGAKPVATESIGFNASYLAEASKACGALSATKYSGVRITLFGPHESIRATCDEVPDGIREACVVVMPMRL
jgi:DNA polymerase III sliding clamp (beta) subunit (PCNA family)